MVSAPSCTRLRAKVAAASSSWMPWTRSNTAGANSLLKLLEEPPAGAVLILVAHSLARILPTIRSRCRLLRMPQISAEDVHAVLQQQAPDLAPEDLAQAASLSQGSPGRALGVLGWRTMHSPFTRPSPLFWQATRLGPIRRPSPPSRSLAGQDPGPVPPFRRLLLLPVIWSTRRVTQMAVARPGIRFGPTPSHLL